LNKQDGNSGKERKRCDSDGTELFIWKNKNMLWIVSAPAVLNQQNGNDYF